MKQVNDKMKTTITIDRDIFKALKKMAIDKEVSQNKLMNEYLIAGLKNEDKNKSKIPEHLIANKDTYNPDPERRMKMAGIIKTDEPFDVAKALEEIRTRKYDPWFS